MLLKCYCFLEKSKPIEFHKSLRKNKNVNKDIL